MPEFHEPPECRLCAESRSLTRLQMEYIGQLHGQVRDLVEKLKDLATETPKAILGADERHAAERKELYARIQGWSPEALEKQRELAAVVDGPDDAAIVENYKLEQDENGYWLVPGAENIFDSPRDAWRFIEGQRLQRSLTETEP